MTLRLNNPPDVLMVDGAARMEQKIDGIPGVGSSVETCWYDASGTLLRQDQCIVVIENVFDVRPESANLG
jgi:hypothetical protein